MEQAGVSSGTSSCTEKRYRANIAEQKNKTARKPQKPEKPCLKNPS
jgi:hypothetical protein